MENVGAGVNVTSKEEAMFMKVKLVKEWLEHKRFPPDHVVVYMDSDVTCDLACKVTKAQWYTLFQYNVDRQSKWRSMQEHLYSVVITTETLKAPRHRRIDISQVMYGGCSAEDFANRYEKIATAAGAQVCTITASSMLKVCRLVFSRILK